MNVEQHQLAVDFTDLSKTEQAIHLVNQTLPTLSFWGTIYATAWTIPIVFFQPW